MAALRLAVVKSTCVKTAPVKLAPEKSVSSKIAPLNGTNELMWSVPDIDVTIGGGVRWAALQDRLSPQDLEDFRIPFGGTPGFVVADLWASYQLWKPFVLLSLVLENLGDAPYRYHGSSINGPGRSLNVMLEIGY